MKKSILLGLLLLLIIPGWAQPTFSRDISPIIYNHCTSCHRPGEIGPMPFVDYASVSAYAHMIAYVTESRYMPPWKADPAFSHLIDENILTDNEIQLIRDWVNAGAPQGNPAEEAPLPTFTTGSQLGTPDTVLSFATRYRHAGTNTDAYRVFVLPTGLTEDRDIAAIEVRPGNKQIVHHTLIAADTTGAARQLDQADPVYGYESFGGFGVTGASQNQFQGYVPGQRIRFFPEGIGQRLYAGSDLLVQMHYAPTAADEYDSTTINIFYKDEPVQRYIENYIMLPTNNILTNGPFIIPANQTRTFHGVWTVPRDISLLAISPHMHLLGQSWEVWAISPTGDSTNLIRISDWDFNWQGTYLFPQMIKVRAGSQIHAYAAYDNTVNNPLNPNSPPTWVTWGERTQDEMYYLPLTFVDYWPGDENVIFTAIDEVPGLASTETQFFPPYPNPARSEIVTGFYLRAAGPVTIELLDLKGQRLRQFQHQVFYPAGRHAVTWPAGDLAPGLYLIQFSAGDYTALEKIMIQP
ncbi:MAG: T9SS type A sorting domain-containing protein [Bacteroidia bacterium]|nr:T9SS type A sorting domain-containing protein [Bacteroidia bacterium]